MFHWILLLTNAGFLRLSLGVASASGRRECPKAKTDGIMIGMCVRSSLAVVDAW